MSVFGAHRRHAYDGVVTAPQSGSVSFTVASGLTAASRTWADRTYVVGGGNKRTIYIAPDVELFNLDWLTLPEVVEQHTIIGALATTVAGTLVVLFGGTAPGTHRYVAIFYEDEPQPAFLLDTLQPGRLGHRLDGIAVDDAGRFVQLLPLGGAVVVWDPFTDTLA